MKTVTIYTDGACSGNPGPGGWGAILMYGAHRKELSGGEAQTTNNRMEMMAVMVPAHILLGRWLVPKRRCAVWISQRAILWWRLQMDFIRWRTPSYLTQRILERNRAL